jgi:tetratricopeptide (TPR) repeat protein
VTRTALLRTALLLGSASLTFALATGCRDEAASAQKAPDAIASSPAASPSSRPSLASEAPLTIARRLALSKAEGNRPVDVEIQQLQKTLEAHPEISDTWVMLGRSWVRRARASSDPGYYLNAKACADVALDLAPSNRAATNLIGIVLINQHKFDEARDLAEQILRKQPMDLMALGTLSDADLEVGRYDQAIEAAQKMMDMKPGLPSYTRASYLAWLRGDGKTALENIHEAIDAGKDPKDPEPRCWVMVQAAMIFWHKGDYAGADAGFDLALKECPDYPPALVGRGRVALGNGDFERAKGALEPSFKESPLAETAWLLGDARAGAGDAKGAEEAYAQVVKIGRATDLRTLALFWATKDREHEEALRLVEAEKKVRDDIYTEDTLGWALYRLGRFADARAASEKATALGTKDARLLYHAGAIRIAAGDKAAGEKLVKEAGALNSKFDVTGAAEAAKLFGSGWGQ